MRLILLLTVFLASALAVSADASALGELKAFPPAKDGMERHVIVLSDKEQADEDYCKVEIIFGKEMLTDGFNIVRLGATIEPRTLTGWGYQYYEVTETGATASTLMAPPPGTAMVKRLVTATSFLTSYNSRLPIVVYAPAGYQVRFRIWSTTPATMPADKR